VKVTVVMPARNVAHEVDATMDSLFAQTRLPDEIVVGDGLSTDDTVGRVLRHASRGVPLRVVCNPSRLAGGGRNAATQAAAHDLIVAMDFGNRAAPTWLESLVRPFEEDPALDLVGGLHYPMLETPWQRVSAAVVYFDECMLRTMDRARIVALIPEDFVPGGMCMAYRRAIWERAGGFSEWARKGQDRLFGFRVRRVGGKLGYTLDAAVYHEMAQSFRALFDRHFHYRLWAARTGLTGAQSWRLSVLYAGVLGLAAAGLLAAPLASPALGLLGLAYVYRGAWRRISRVAEATGVCFGLRDRALAVGVLFVRDAAIVGGNALGAVDRLLRPSWRRRTEAYLERGA
jgi:GT2 family glycosyltransferase